jgi:LacI family transcriptional regulator
MQKKKITLKDIAKRAGVSTALVSYVMNGKDKQGKVGKEMATKILAISKELNFKPHYLARSLRSGKSFTLGLVIADISNPFFANIARVVENEAKRFGYTVFYGSSDEDAEKSFDLIDMLHNKSVDGFIIVPTENSQSKIRSLVEENIPFVLLDRFFPEIQTNYVSTNNYQSSFDACTHLLEMGYKNIGLLGMDSALHHMKERIRGYEDALEIHGIKRNPDWLRKIRQNEVSVKTRCAIDEMLSNDQPVDAIIFCTYSLAVSALKYINELKLKVPEQLGIVSFGQAELFDLYHCPITYIMQQMNELGKKAVEILIKKIENPETPTQQVLMQASIIKRESSKKKISKTTKGYT